MPRLRRDRRGLPRLRWLAGDQNGQEWPIRWLLELSGLQLHAKPSAVSAGAQHVVRRHKIQKVQTTLTAVLCVATIAIRWNARTGRTNVAPAALDPRAGDPKGDSPVG